MGEPAGHDDGVGPAQLGLGVPEHLGGPAEMLDRPRHVELAVRARELDDADARAHVDGCEASSLSSISYASMTGLASKR